uniref:Uncharacterized protein n=1 Tax=Rhipicephalus zambeziensis TaxID=60191 RepID=A0A224YGH9_9ACAR
MPESKLNDYPAAHTKQGHSLLLTTLFLKSKICSNWHLFYHSSAKRKEKGSLARNICHVSTSSSTQAPGGGNKTEKKHVVVANGITRVTECILNVL